uniref:Sulfotransferase n=1 Tax=Serinus canaria TaxID=9135 RepID=A0A8C9N0H4_SERCA
MVPRDPRESCPLSPHSPGDLARGSPGKAVPCPHTALGTWHGDPLGKLSPDPTQPWGAGPRNPPAGCPSRVSQLGFSHTEGAAGHAAGPGDLCSPIDDRRGAHDALGLLQVLLSSAGQCQRQHQHPHVPTWHLLLLGVAGDKGGPATTVRAHALGWLLLQRYPSLAALCPVAVPGLRGLPQPSPGGRALQNTGSPRLLTTHLPARVLAPCGGDTVSLQVIYVARNPKDVAVSFYHFHHLAKFLPDPSSFDAFLTQFLEGTVHYGSWFDHVKGWLGQRHLLDILSFLGCPLAPGTLAALEQHCSFSAMRDNAMANYSLIPAEIMDHSQGRFMRKGVVGDWRSHFSPEQNALFNRRYQEEMGDTELPSQWPMA